MKKRFAQNLQWQYFVSYLAVMLLTMAVFFAYAFNSFSAIHANSILDDYADRLVMMRNEQEDALEDMIAIAGQIMSVTSGVAFDFYQAPDEGRNMVDHLTAYRATHDAFAGVYIHFYGDDFVYTSSGSFLMQRFVQNMLLLDGTDREAVVRYFDETTHLTVLPAQNIEGYLFERQMGVKRMVPVFVPVSISGGMRCGTALFLVEDAVYESWFDLLAEETAEVYVLRDGELIISRQAGGVPLDAAKAAVDAQQSTLTHEGARYRLLWLENQRFGFQYIMVFPETLLKVGMSAPIKMLMVLTALVGALGLAFIHYFVQKRMKPIKLLHSMISDGEPEGNELIEIRDGLQRLIDENAAMMSQMEDMETLRKSDFVRRFLNGLFATEDEFLAAAESISLNVDTALFAVAIIAKPLDTDYELTVDKVNHLFEGEVSGVARSLDMQGRIVVVAFANEQKALTDCVSMKFMGMRACCPGVTMAVSACHEDFRDGQRAYLEAENAFELRFIKGNEAPLHFVATIEQSGGDMQGYQQSVERLRTALHIWDAAAVSRSLREITTAMRGMHVSLFDFRCMYNDILNVVSSEARSSGMDETAVYDMFKLSQCLSLYDLDDMLHQVCSRLLAGQSSAQPGDAAEEILRAREIIARRFSEASLSVAAIAAEVGMSDSRLSTDFKKVYRMTPLECITMCRMRRARRLLQTTDMPVKDIAVECGYYDISAFNRRFKAYNGMTPQQYKQSGDTQEEPAAQEETT